MSFGQKVTYDAGVTSSKEIFEINDLDPRDGSKTGPISTVPHSSYKIVETSNLVFTYSYESRKKARMGVLGAAKEKNLNIADGERRPGSR
jgi:hypothetical protein